jgi:hypothetical protein
MVPWKFLAASLRARERGGDALTKLRMPNGKLMENCTLEYHKRVGEFLGAVGTMHRIRPPSLNHNRFV